MKDFYKSSFPGSYFAQQHREKGYNTTTDTETRRIATNSIFSVNTEEQFVQYNTKKNNLHNRAQLNFASIELEQCGVEAVKCGESPAFASSYTVGNIFYFFLVTFLCSVFSVFSGQHFFFVSSKNGHFDHNCTTTWFHPEIAKSPNVHFGQIVQLALSSSWLRSIVKFALVYK